MKQIEMIETRPKIDGMKMQNGEEKKQAMMRERTNKECHNAHNAHISK